MRHECGSRFFDWFLKEKAAKLKLSAIASVRERAGLGSPPCAFNTNASETVNFMLKSKVDYKKNAIPEFIQKMFDLLTNQEEELQCAVCGLGKWRFTPAFKYLEVTSATWFCMKADERRRYLENRVHGTYLIDAQEYTESATSIPAVDGPVADDSTQLPSSLMIGTEKTYHLSVNVESFSKSVSVPFLTLSGMLEIYFRTPPITSPCLQEVIHKQEW